MCQTDEEPMSEVLRVSIDLKEGLKDVKYYILINQQRSPHQFPLFNPEPSFNSHL